METSKQNKSEQILSITIIALLISVFVLVLFNLDGLRESEKAVVEREYPNYEYIDGLISSRAANLLQDEIGGSTFLVFLAFDDGVLADDRLNIDNGIEVFAVDANGMRIKLDYNDHYKMFEKELEPDNYSEGDRIEIEIAIDNQIIWQSTESIAFLY